MSDNNNLHHSRRIKDDEFYTRYVDIEAELSHYSLKNKLLYANCDKINSNFVTYFSKKKLNYIHTSSDFRLPENRELLKRADAIITNPPFSLFRQYLQLLLDTNKQFLIIGNLNAITYSMTHKHIINNKMRTGVTQIKKLIRPNGTIVSTGNTLWYTNMKNNHIRPFITLNKEYSPNHYHRYDDFDAINVDKVSDIPYNYKGLMGVPISFLTKHNPKQFTIVNISRTHMMGKEMYYRIIIKRL